MKTLLCRWSLKHRHRSSGKADAQLRSLQQRTPGYIGHVYLCSFCHDWHVGSGKQGRAA